MKLLRFVLYLIYFLLALTCTGSLLYVVMWLEALRKGWLV
jgi:hypothetical protein